MPKNFSQKGALSLLLLIAGLGAVAFLVIATSSEFKDQLFGRLYKKPKSFAASNPVSWPVTPSPVPTPATTPVTTSFPKDIINPTVNITYPENGASFKSKSYLTIQANASDNVKVARVEFYLNNIYRCTDIITPYTCSVRLGPKKGVTYTISAKAYDSSGNTAASTINISTTR